MRFSVVTATFNRAHTLGRLYASLCNQSFRDFEWVIVDDGSTDGTRELVGSWAAAFPIRYFWKKNGGKHTAMNLGVSEAMGEFVALVDSDDELKPNALERFDFRWKQIPHPEQFSTLTALASKPDGTIMGELFPEDHVDAYTFADQYHFRGKVDRWGINRTDVLREFPFPEGERFVPEALVWNRLSRRYATRFFNEALLIVHPSADSLSRKSVDLRASSPNATLTYYRELALSPARIEVRARAAANFGRFAMLAAARRIRRR